MAERDASASAAGASRAAARPCAGVRVTPFPLARAAASPVVGHAFDGEVAARAEVAPRAPRARVRASARARLGSRVARSAGLRLAARLTGHALRGQDGARGPRRPGAPTAAVGQAGTFARL